MIDTTRVNLMLRTETPVYRRIAAVAARDGIPVANVVETLLQLNIEKILERELPRLEKER